MIQEETEETFIISESDDSDESPSAEVEAVDSDQQSEEEKTICQ
jgi:hypothetical protein